MDNRLHPDPAPTRVLNPPAPPEIYFAAPSRSPDYSTLPENPRPERCCRAVKSATSQTLLPPGPADSSTTCTHQRKIAPLNNDRASSAPWQTTTMPMRNLVS